MSNKMEDDREEGEIVDDDLEDISDNPIIEPSFTGKCVSSIGHLRAISLSSLSDEEETTPQKIKKRRRTKKESKHVRRTKSNRRRSSCYSDSDSSGIEICGVIPNPFKAAVLRVDTEDCPKNNSLKTRLKMMTQKKNESDNFNSKQSSHETKSVTDADVQKQSTVLQENKDSDTDCDNELIQLRLEALKTAFINKHGSRKKRKCRDMINNADSKNLIMDETEVDKENTLVINTNIDESKKTAEKVENTNEATLLDEDPDVLRAELLASMAKKIVGDQPEPTPNITVKVNHCIKKSYINKNPAFKPKTSFKVNHVKNNSVTVLNKPLKLPQVKPLIISVNGESDSDDEIEPAGSIVRDANTLIIENTVEQFLKEQRAKVEAEKKLSIPEQLLSPNNQSCNTSLKMVAKNLPKLTIPMNYDKTPIKSKKSPIIEKSAVKLLPRSKQIEYQRLLLKLKNAERKTRIRRNSFKANLDINKNTPLQKNNTTKNKFSKNKTTSIPKSPNSLERKTEALKLHKTLKEMQIEKNGRLQIQDKYRVLTPLMRKINEASKERKKCDQDVKRLLEELTEAKKKQVKSQENFTAAIKELYSQKQKIDVSHKKQLSVKKVTSAPIKKNSPTSSNILCSNVMSQAQACENNVGKIQTSDVLTEQISHVEVNFGDPNDIDLIINKQSEKIPKYVSPLDVARTENVDPFSIMCPFEVDGLCKDPECTYKHYLR